MDSTPVARFTYLCFFLGSTAYKAEQFQPVREALLTNDSSRSEHWEIDPRINRAGCAPFHRLRIKDLAPVVIHVVTCSPPALSG